MKLLNKFRNFIDYLQFFASARDVLKFSALRRPGNTSKEEVHLGVRHPRGAVLICRPNTSDANVLWDVFWEEYHLPNGDIGTAPVIFDLGANVGFTCFDFARRYPDARVVGVEMDQDNMGLAVRNTAVFGDRCTVFHAAVWKEDTEVSYSKSDSEWGYHASDIPANPDDTVAIVRAVTIDTLMRETGVSWVDFMKMDIEGAEQEVLYPQAPWLQNVGVLNLEVHHPATVEGCIALLSEAGFDCTKSTQHTSALLAVKRPLGAS